MCATSHGAHMLMASVVIFAPKDGRDVDLAFKR